MDRCLFAVLLVFAFSLTVGIALSQISLGVAIAVWLAKCVLSRRWLGRSTPLDRWLGLFLATCLLSTIFSVAPKESAVHLKKFYLVSAFYLLSWQLRDIGQVRKLLEFFLYGAALTSALGLARHLSGVDTRMIGTQSTAMTSGGIYMLAGLMGLSLLMAGYAGARKTKRVIDWLVVVMITAGLFFTKTISAWLAWIAGSMTVFHKKRWILAALAIAVMLLGALFIFQDRAMHTFLTVHKPGSMQVRLNQWRLGWQMFKERPVTGYGLIDLQAQYRNIPYDNPYWREAVSTGHLHNNLFHIAVTTGTIGLISFILLWVAIYRMLAKAIRDSVDESRAYVRSILACAIGFMAAGMFEWNFGDSEPVTIIWFVLGMASAIYRNHIGAKEGMKV